MIKAVEIFTLHSLVHNYRSQLLVREDIIDVFTDANFCIEFARVLRVRNTGRYREIWFMIVPNAVAIFAVGRSFTEVPQIRSHPQIL